MKYYKLIEFYKKLKFYYKQNQIFHEISSSKLIVNVKAISSII